MPAYDFKCKDCKKKFEVTCKMGALISTPEHSVSFVMAEDDFVAVGDSIIVTGSHTVDCPTIIPERFGISEQHDGKVINKAVLCPKCKSANIERVYNSYTFHFAK